MRRLKRSLLALALLAPLAAACHPHRSSASSADSHAPGTTTASVAADCSKYPQGAPGVIRTFCDGPAVVKVSVGGVARTLAGGTCDVSGGMFTLNLGVVAGPDLAGARPDYVGLISQVATGPFSNATLSLTLDGKGYVVAQNSGSVSSTGGSFTGKTLVGGQPVIGTFTC